jgi:Cu(I)/Ag(I) efflux system periplasmic protein CusF
MKFVSNTLLSFTFSLSAAGLALANDAHHGHGSEPAAQATTAMTAGEIRKIDKAAGKMTIKHGPLANLGMPSMTMAFRVIDPGMLDQAKPGESIRFEAGKVNGALTVMKLETVR